MKIIILSLLFAISAIAAPPTGYNLRFNGNFKGKGGNADGWLPIVQSGPLPPYVLGNELWYPEFYDPSPDGRGFNTGFWQYITFSNTTLSQANGKMTCSPYQDSSGKWYGFLLATCDNNIQGYTVSPPFYATCYMSLPSGGRDVWPAFWMTTANRILPRPQTTNSAEIDVIEMYGSAPYTQEIHVNTRDVNGNNLTASADFASNPGALNQYGEFYSVWVNTDTIHFYVESGTWNGLPAGDIHEVFNCPYVSNGMSQPWYLMVDYAMQDRSWTGQQYTLPTPMWVKGFQIFTP